MSEVNKQYVVSELLKELAWWLVSIVVAIVIMFPLISKLHYKAMWINGALLVIAMTFFRYAVLLRTTFVLKPKWIRFVLFVFNINFFVFVLRKMQSFMYIYDSYTLDAMGLPRYTLKPEDTDQLFRYFFNEINFTCIACMALAVALSVRIVLSYWKTAHTRLNAGNEE